MTLETAIMTIKFLWPLVLGSSDLNYRTKQIEVGDAQSFGHESADRDSVP